MSSAVAVPALNRGRVLRAVGVLGAGRAWVVLLGFAKNVAAAHYFGTSRAMDIYFVALLIPDLAQYMAVTGLFNFIPLWSKARASGGEQAATETTGRIGTMWVCFLLAGISVAYLVAPSALGMIAPGFGAAARHEAASYTRTLLGMALAVGSARILNAVLLARHRFGVPPVGEVMFQASSLGYLLLCHDWGVPALVWGMVLGGFAQLLVSTSALLRLGVRAPLRFRPRDESVRRMLRLSVPVYIGYGGAKINGIVTRAFASMLAAGALSSLQYALFMVDAIVEAFSFSVIRALFPFFAESFAAEGTLSSRLKRSVVLTSLLALPVAIGLITLAQPLVELLLQRGSFDAESTRMTVAALRWYAPAVWAMLVNDVLTSAYYAQMNTATPVKVGLARVAITAAGCVALVPSFGHVGIAAAQSLGHLSKAWMMLAFLPRDDDRRSLREAAPALARMLVAAVCMGLTVHLFLSAIPPLAATTFVARAAVVASAVLLGAIVYGYAAHRLCSSEIDYCLRALRDAVGGRRSRA